MKKNLKKIDYEIRFNKPDFAPYPANIVRQSEFLLFAQVCLSNIWEAKLRKDKWNEKFETDMYNKVMKTYYDWYQNG